MGLLLCGGEGKSRSTSPEKKICRCVDVDAAKANNLAAIEQDVERPEADSRETAEIKNGTARCNKPNPHVDDQPGFERRFGHQASMPSKSSMCCSPLEENYANRYSVLYRVRSPSTIDYSADGKACLAKNGYQESRCQAQIDALYDCCNAFYQEQGDDASTVSCPKARLLRLKMAQRAQEADRR